VSASFFFSSSCVSLKASKALPCSSIRDLISSKAMTGLLQTICVAAQHHCERQFFRRLLVASTCLVGFSGITPEVLLEARNRLHGVRSRKALLAEGSLKIANLGN